MAWTTPMTFSAGSVLTAAQLNTYLRDNSNTTPAALATTAGSLFVATGTNAIVERAVPSGLVSTIQTTTSTSPTDLATTGPAVTVTTGTIAVVILSAYMANNTSGETNQMTVAVSGASTVAASNDNSLFHESGAANDAVQHSYVAVLTGLTAGSNTFTAKYAVSAGTGSFGRRRLIVFPFGT